MNYPEMLVLDAYGWLPRFQALAQQYASKHPCCRSEFFVPDLVCHLVDRLRERRRAEHSLRRLASLIQAGECHSHGDYVPAEFHSLVFDFGLHLLHQLDSAKVWGDDGVLPYRMHHPRHGGAPDLSAVYLRRTQEPVL